MSAVFLYAFSAIGDNVAQVGNERYLTRQSSVERVLFLH